MRHILPFLIGCMVLMPSAGAHGSMQKIVEGKYLLNLSSAPLSPTVGQQQQNMLSISDVETNSLIEKNSIFSVMITKNEKTFFEAQNIVATGGLLPVYYAYPEPGIYELTATFRFPGENHVYEPEDYWIQVHPSTTASSISSAAETATEKPVAPLPFAPLISGIVIGLVIGMLLWKRKKLA